MNLKNVAQTVITQSLAAAQPQAAVKRALEQQTFAGNIHVVAIGKAARAMAQAATQVLGDKISDGVVITKYGHGQGELDPIRIFEAGHPVPDQNSYLATQAAIDLVAPLQEQDTVLFLVSGGGSALFEKPLIAPEEMQAVTEQLLASGADITEINTIRKRLSAVKGGRFAQLCAPARVYAIVLSDIIGDPLDMIASGPAYPDRSTCAQAKEIADRYQLQLSPEAVECLQQETPKEVSNVTTAVTGSVTQLCEAAAQTCQTLGIEPRILTASLCCTARDAGSFLGSIAQFHHETDRPVAYILGGETVVKLTGHGKGGRNQELALAAAMGLEGLEGVACFSVGSDGTDGPTDAAGGYVDGTTAERLRTMGISIPTVLAENDAYHALEKVDGLIMTGPTGTNVNDLSVLLLDTVK